MQGVLPRKHFTFELFFCLADTSKVITNAWFSMKNYTCREVWRILLVILSFIDSNTNKDPNCFPQQETFTLISNEVWKIRPLVKYRPNQNMLVLSYLFQFVNKITSELLRVLKGQAVTECTFLISISISCTGLA